jgi:hypothetical protein
MATLVDLSFGSAELSCRRWRTVANYFAYKIMYVLHNNNNDNNNNVDCSFKNIQL